jgi:hypothetical protein
VCMWVMVRVWEVCVRVGGSVCVRDCECEGNG